MSGWSPGPDEACAELAATGLMRIAAVNMPQQMRDRAWLWQVRVISFAGSWLELPSRPAPCEPRVPVAAVTRVLARQAAELLLTAHQGDSAQALAWICHQSAQAREQAHGSGIARPAEPTAFALVWHAIQTTKQDLEPHRSRQAERYAQYVSHRNHRQDALALLLSCARIAAAALIRVSCSDPGRMQQHLDQHASRLTQRDEPVPPWVPDHLERLAPD